MSIGGGIVLNPTFGTGGGSTPATFTLDPDPFDIGTALSDTAELASDRLAGVRVSLDGDIAAVASIATPLSWDGGGCGEGVGEVLVLTVTRTGGTFGQSYEGEIVVEDDTGAEHRFDVSLMVPITLLDIVTAQGSWDYVWAMDTAGTSQPNRGGAGVKALALTQARATTSQMGALGRFPLLTDTADRAQSAAGIAMGAGAKAVVVCLEITDTTVSRGIWGGGSSGDPNNMGFLAVAGGGGIQFQNHSLSAICSMATASTGVWLLAVSSDAAGACTAWARKVGGARQDSSGARGTTSGGSTMQTLGGDGAAYFSVEGNYFFAALRTGTEMTGAEFDALFATLS